MGRCLVRVNGDGNNDAITCEILSVVILDPMLAVITVKRHHPLLDMISFHTIASDDRALRKMPPIIQSKTQRHCVIEKEFFDRFTYKRLD